MTAEENISLMYCISKLHIIATYAQHMAQASFHYLG